MPSFSLRPAGRPTSGQVLGALSSARSFSPLGPLLANRKGQTRSGWHATGSPAGARSPARGSQRKSNFPLARFLARPGACKASAKSPLALPSDWTLFSPRFFSFARSHWPPPPPRQTTGGARFSHLASVTFELAECGTTCAKWSQQNSRARAKKLRQIGESVSQASEKDRQLGRPKGSSPSSKFATINRLLCGLVGAGSAPKAASRVPPSPMQIALARPRR